MNRFRFQTLLLRSPDGPAGGGPAASGSTAPSTGGDASSSSSTGSSGGASSGTPSSGGSPSPAAPTTGAPTGPGTSTSPQPVGDNFFDLSGLESFDGGDDDTPTSPPPPPPTTPPGQPQQSPPQQPTNQPQQPQAPAPGSQPPTQTPSQPNQPGPQGAASIPSPAEPDKIADAMLASFDDISNHLASTPEFQMSRADVEALEQGDYSVVGKVAARTYVRAQAMAMKQMAKVIPAMVEKQISVMRRQMERENSFYGKWPQLDRSKHGDIVTRYARSYRSMNPQASFDQMVADVGTMVMHAAGVQAAPQNGAGQPVPRGGSPRPPQSAPFVPAQTGGTGGPPQPQASDPWAGLAGGGDNDE